MRFLNNGLKGRESLLIDPAKAQDFAAVAEKFGFSDVISKLLGARPEAYVMDGVGVIPISGVIGKGLSPLEKMVGAVDVDDISDAIDVFEEDPNVNRIAFHVSSPGGTVTGVEELAKKIRGISVPTMAYTDTEMASAAYWLGSQADHVIASPSSTVGSVGVYLVVPDFSEAYKQAGVDMKVIKAGKFKAAGLEGTSLSEEQVKNLQEGVDEIHADFRNAVRSVRSRVKDEDMEGQVFSGRQAAARGMVTGLADSFREALAKF
jgi:protease-4